jgi:hypothetical protein
MNDATRYTKQTVTMQYTETVYFKDGIEIGRETNNDDHSYDADAPVPMSADEIDDWVL